MGVTRYERNLRRIATKMAAGGVDGADGAPYRARMGSETVDYKDYNLFVTLENGDITFSIVRELKTGEIRQQEISVEEVEKARKGTDDAPGIPRALLVSMVEFMGLLEEARGGKGVTQDYYCLSDRGNAIDSLAFVGVYQGATICKDIYEMKGLGWDAGFTVEIYDGAVEYVVNLYERGFDRIKLKVKHAIRESMEETEGSLNELREKIKSAGVSKGAPVEIVDVIKGFDNELSKRIRAYTDRGYDVFKEEV